MFTQRRAPLKPRFAPDEHVTELGAPPGRAAARDRARRRAREAAVAAGAARRGSSSRFELLTRRPPRPADERQQTLRATIDWSYDLLEAADDRASSLALAVFAGGCTPRGRRGGLPAPPARSPGIATLIDNNLLRQEDQPDGEPRFTMLETIRAYALGRLASNGRTRARPAAPARRVLPGVGAASGEGRRDAERHRLEGVRARAGQLPQRARVAQNSRRQRVRGRAHCEPRDAIVVDHRLHRGRGKLARVGRRARRDAPAQARGAPDPGSCQSRLER